MKIRLNMVGHFTRDIEMDTCPRQQEIVTYTDMCQGERLKLNGKVRYVEHLYDCETEEQIVIVVCDVRIAQ